LDTPLVDTTRFASQICSGSLGPPAAQELNSLMDYLAGAPRIPAVVELAEKLFVRWTIFRDGAAYPGDVHVMFQRNIFVRDIPAPNAASHAGGHRHAVGEISSVGSRLRLTDHNPADRRNQG